MKLKLATVLVVFLFASVCYASQVDTTEYEHSFNIRQGIAGRAFYFNDMVTPNYHKYFLAANKAVYFIPKQYNVGKNINFFEFHETIDKIALKEGVKRVFTDEEGFYQTELSIGEYYVILDENYCTGPDGDRDGCKVEVKPLSVTKYNIVVPGG